MVLVACSRDTFVGVEAGWWKRIKSDIFAKKSGIDRSNSQLRMRSHGSRPDEGAATLEAVDATAEKKKCDCGCNGDELHIVAVVAVAVVVGVVGVVGVVVGGGVGGGSVVSVVAIVDFDIFNFVRSFF